jgi:hypothetical protein
LEFQALSTEAVMARWSDTGKRREWSERLKRFARWDGTVAEFCDAERVSVPSFYQWKRKLAAPETPRTFIPVQLASATSAASTTVEIELPNGTRIRLPASDRQLLTAAITAAGQVAVSPRGQSASSAEEAEEAPC